MANFDRSYHQNIIVNRIDITSKYGLRFVTIDKDSSWGEGDILNLSISKLNIFKPHDIIISITLYNLYDFIK